MCCGQMLEKASAKITGVEASHLLQCCTSDCHRLRQRIHVWLVYEAKLRSSSKKKDYCGATYSFIGRTTGRQS
jgi:hypothetical protein